MSLDDRVLDYIARLSNLKDLNLMNISGITNLRIMKLKSLRYIEALSIQFCPRVTRDGLGRLQRALPASSRWNNR